MWGSGMKSELVCLCVLVILCVHAWRGWGIGFVSLSVCQWKIFKPEYWQGWISKTDTCSNIKKNALVYVPHMEQSGSTLWFTFNVRTVCHFNSLDTVEPGICRIDACRSTKYFRYGGGVWTYTDSTHSPQVISLPYLTPPHINKIYVHVQVWVSIIQSTGYKLLMVQPCILNNAHHSAPQHLPDP